MGGGIDERKETLALRKSLKKRIRLRIDKMDGLRSELARLQSDLRRVEGRLLLIDDERRAKRKSR